MHILKCRFQNEVTEIDQTLRVSVNFDLLNCLILNLIQYILSIL